MNPLRAITPATRLSIALAFVTMSVMLSAGALGLMPDGTEELIEARLRTAEAVAIQLSLVATDHAEDAAVTSFMTGLVKRDPLVRSIAILDQEHGLSIATDGHRSFWSQRETNGDAPDWVELPVDRGDGRRQTVQVCFVPVVAPGLLGPKFRLALFVALLGGLLYCLYLRRVLKHLDPSAVIPERVRAMLDTMAEGVLILDDRERIVLANAAFERASGVPFDKLLGRRASQIPGLAAHAPTVEFPWQRSVAEGESARGVEIRLDRGDDEESHVFMVNASPILGGDGKQRGSLATFDDVTAIERKNARLQQMVRELDDARSKVQKQNEELTFLATRDALTSCLNRRALFERLDEHWSGVGRYEQSLSCIMLDIDHFKLINDDHGHAAGDQVLARVGKILKEKTRGPDIVGRYGGEEFCIILPHTNLAKAAAAAEKIRSALATEIIGGLSVTASFGVSSAELGAQEPKELIDQADKALYTAKRSGRNRVVRWDEAGDVPQEVLADTSDEADAPQEFLESQIPFQAVIALMSALSQRDAGTASHCRRVADLCMVAARDLMSAGDLFVMEVAALLHDIGKIGVPDAILLKPGPLTAQEWEVMESHDRIGIEIINSAFQSTELTNIVRNHHAFFGGKGRDSTLPVGRDIPVRARILSIADAYDAMVSDRVYREGRSPEKAFEELRRCAGTQFDPDLVERFITAVSGQPGAKDSAGLTVEVMLSLGLAMERLVAAIDAEDLVALGAIANRLRHVATKHGWLRIAEEATALCRAVDGDGDLTSLLESTRTLLNLCNELHDSCLDAARSSTSERRVA